VRPEIVVEISFTDWTSNGGIGTTAPSSDEREELIELLSANLRSVHHAWVAQSW
jgi:hypothetical protein